MSQQEELLVTSENQPQLNTRRLSAITVLGHALVVMILTKDHLRTYHFTPVRNLLSTDLLRRLEFAQMHMRISLTILSFSLMKPLSHVVAFITG